MPSPLFGRRHPLFARLASRPLLLEDSAPEEPAAPRVIPPLSRARRIEGPVADLLNASPTVTVAPEGLREAFLFAFAAGDDGGAWKRALSRAPLADSRWEPACFADDLFLEDFATLCLRPRIGTWSVPIDQAYLLRTLSCPPSDDATVALRRGVLEDLRARPAARSAVEQLYRSLYELREQLGGDGAVHRGDLSRERMDLLRKLASTFDAMSAEALRDAPSALTRVAALGDDIRASEAYARLRELVDFDERRAEAEVTVRLGADGRVRGLEILALRENVDNRYHRSLLARVSRKLKLLLSGYRVTGSELVDRWLDSTFEGALPYLPALVQLMGDLELYLAGLALGDRAAERGLTVCFADLSDDGETHLEGLYDPLLFAQDVAVTPTSLALPQSARIALITGPNSGGKTRLLEARALCQLLGQGGLLVPAAQARLRRASGLFASLREAPSVAQREGRLGMELVRIRTLFERAEPGYLIVVDELCSGTNPTEGEEIFHLVLELLRALQPEAYISSHFLQFVRALEAEAEPLGLAFFQAHLDDHLRPTYDFVPGVARTSLAKQTASRLGVTREGLLALIDAKRARP